MSSDFITRRRLENLHFAKYTLSLVLVTTKSLRAPSYALWVLATTKPTHLQPDGLCSNTICTTSWYTKTSLYHILSHVVPIWAHGCTIFIVDRFIN
jgi:hypothetical protein